MNLLSGRNSGWVAFAVVAVIGAVRGNIVALGRLRELPDFGERDSALRGVRRARGKRAAGRGRAGVIDCPVDDPASGGVLADVFCGDDVLVVFRGDARAVDAGTESGGGD
jgi:hypothetical protein